jgi:hypothetical protein
LLSFGAESFVFQFAINKCKYRTISLPVVLYGCETWSLTLRKKYRMRVFENMVLRRMFESKRYEVTGEWRRLHKKELYALYSSPNIIRVIVKKNETATACSTNGKSTCAYRVLVGRPEGKRPLGRPRCRWEDNIKMDL